MSTANRSWDGKQLTGTVSGFSEYNTGVASNATETVVLAAASILNKINEMQRFLSLPDLDHALKVIYDHIQQKGNPHRTTLSQFVDQLIDVLYAEYVKRGGDKTLAQYTHSLFKVLHVASVDELEKGTDPTALVSIGAIRDIIHNHEVNPDAHKELIEKMFPGSPITADPAFSLLSAFGVLEFYTSKVTTTDPEYPYTYVGKDGYIHVAKPGVLPTDYAYGEPMIACFGQRTNLIPKCSDFNSRTKLHITANENTKDPMNNSLASKIKSKADTEAARHGITLEDISLEGGVSKSFSIYAKSASCRYLVIQFIDLDYKTNVNAIFDIENGSYIIQNHMDLYKADIVKVGHGWYRCEFTMLSKVDQLSKLNIYLFKEKDPRQQDFAFKGTDGEHLADLFGMQLEEGPNASPFIFSKSTVLTRMPINVKIPINTSDWEEKAFTLNVGFRRLESDPYITDRPICTVYKDTKLINEVVWRSNSMVEVDHWCEITTQNTTITTLIDQIMFEKQTNRYGQVTTSIDSSNISSAYNEVVETRVTPSKYTIGNIVRVGSDGLGNYFDGYINKVIVYPCGCNTNQLVYLNGDDIDGN